MTEELKNCDVCENLMVFYAGVANDLLEFEDAFILDADLLVRIEYPHEWTREVGSYNHGIQAGKDLELLCRLLAQKGACRVINVSKEAAGNEFSKEDIAFTYAYMFRHHMGQLYARQTMNMVFEDICNLMQQKGCFSQFKQCLNAMISDEKMYERLASDTAPFLVLRGDDTCGGLLRQFADDLTGALSENGQAVIEYGGESAKEEETNTLNEFQSKIWKGIIGFQATALEIPYFKKLHGPKFQFWFDNPLTFRNVLRDLPQDYQVLCQDGDYADWIRKYYCSNAIHFSPGGMEIPTEETDRTMEIIFVGNYIL